MNESRQLAVSAVLVMVFTLLFIPAAGVMGLYLHASRDLPDFRRITDYRPPLVTTVHARDGRIIGYLYREMRFLVSLDEVPGYLPQAILAIEDSSFYEHEGVDLLAMVRATIVNFMAGDVVQGGSTITQQIVKQLLLSSEKKLQRKIKEAILAYRLENNLDKDEILTIYMNHVFFGANAYGVEAAARTYFGVHARDLTLAQAALLAGLPKAPTTYNPLHNPEAAKVRQRQVLRRMLELGWIEPEAYARAMAEELEFRSMDDPSWSMGAYYLEEVRRWLVENLSREGQAALGIDLGKYGEDAVYECGLHVYTALEPEHQRAAEAALRHGLEASTRRRGWRGPVLHLQPLEFAAFLGAQDMGPHDLEPGAWAEVLVVESSGSGARVLVGDYEGVIPASGLDGFGGGRVRLAPGDVVWASVADVANDGTGTNRVFTLEQRPLVQGALVSLEPPTGEVVALVGGYDFALSQFNRATQARRQPGSAFKPIVYSAALDHGMTPATVIVDAPLTIGSWSPRNYGGRFYGPTSLRTALVHSRNVVTVRITQRMGVDAVIERAQALGLEAEFPPVLPICLGAVALRPINLCQAYTAFARDGSRVRPRLVLSVRGPWGEELYESHVEAVDAVSARNAHAMATLLQEVVRYGTGRRALALGRPVAGKTGTTNDEVDAWFMGFTPYLLSGVYVGFDRLTPMGRGEAGASAALPIWLEYRQAVEENYPVQDFPAPPDAEYVTADGRRMPMVTQDADMALIGADGELDYETFGDGPGNEQLLHDMF